MRPGISVRPPPSMARVSVSVAIGVDEIRSILLPRTSTFEAPESWPPLPLKMRTFWNTVAAGAGTGVCAGVCALSGTANPQMSTRRIDLAIMVGLLRWRGRALSSLTESASIANGLRAAPFDPLVLEAEFRLTTLPVTTLPAGATARLSKHPLDLERPE